MMSFAKEKFYIVLLMVCSLLICSAVPAAVLEESAVDALKIELLFSNVDLYRRKQITNEEFFGIMILFIKCSSLKTVSILSSSESTWSTFP